MVQDDPTSKPTSVPPAQQAYDRRERLLVAGGVHWRVRLVSSFDRRGPDLLFESDSVIRRVRSYPENWYDLNDEELLRLSWNR